MGLEFDDIVRESADAKNSESSSLLEDVYGSLTDGFKKNQQFEILTNSLSTTVTELFGNLELFDSGAGTLGDFSNRIGKRTFETRTDGATTYTVKDGDTLSHIAEASLKEQHKDDPNYKPTPEEVQRQVDAIARANQIKDKNLIHTGDELVIPSVSGHVVRDFSGTVTEVQYPDGKSAKIDYSGFEPKTIKFDSGSRWEKQGNGWVHYDKSGKPDGLEADSIEVSRNGEINIKLKDSPQEMSIRPDGSITDKEPDGSVVTHDDRDRVTEVKYPDGSSRQIEYGSDGNPKAIASSDGTTWKKEGNHWNQYRGDEKTGLTADDVLVRHNGEIRMLMSDSDQEIILGRDGSRGDRTSDGSTVTSDVKGHVTKIEYPDGVTAKLEYEGDNLKSIKQSNGISWEKDGDAWVQKRDGKETGIRADDLKINENGDITMTFKDAKQEMTAHRDGSVTDKSTADNSAITIDANNRVIKIEYPNGSSWDIKNDAEGNPIEMRSGAFVWRKEGNHWTQYDQNGRRGTGLRMKSIEVSKSGTVTFEDANGDGIIFSRDGSSTQVHISHDVEKKKAA
ncbi:MAG TPA: LysM domain-containing protein [Candidatus Obscuribacterales bacterium]